MSISSVTYCPPIEVRLASLATLLFLLLLPLAIRKRRLGAGLTLFPLLVTGSVAWLGLERVMRVMALIGTPSVAATSAGIAEAQRSLLLGAFAAMFSALVAAVSAWCRPNTETPNRALLAIAIAAAAITALEPPFTFIFPRYASPFLLDALAVVAFAGALAALGAARGAAARPLLIAAACEGCVGIAAWLVLRHFEQIAMYGLR